MGFVQVIQYKTSKNDEMRALDAEWEAAAGKAPGVERVVVCGDRDNASQYFVFAFFDSYEAAMENSNRPMTQEFAGRMMALADGPPTFYNLDVIDDKSY